MPAATVTTPRAYGSVTRLTPSTTVMPAITSYTRRGSLSVGTRRAYGSVRRYVGGYAIKRWTGTVWSRVYVPRS